MGSKSTSIGMEVPYIGTDSIKWIEASVPDIDVRGSGRPFAPPTQDYASCAVIGSGSRTPPTYFVWRICERKPSALEILELRSDKGIPIVGLRVVFPEALSPFAYICKNEANSARGSVYLLYALSVSGIAYVFQLKNMWAYAVSFVFSSNEFLWFDTKMSLDCRPISAVTVAAGCLVIGRHDGSVSCFRLGVDKDAPGFMHELKDEATFSRFWGLMSRGRFTGSVKDLAVSDVHGKKLIFVLHSDGTVQIWDLQSNNKIFSQSLSDRGTTSRLWVGPLNVDSSVTYLAIFHEEATGTNMDGISIFNLHFRSGERYGLSLDPSVHYIPLSEEKLIDVKFSLNKLWILKENDLLEWDLHSTMVNVEERKCYSLQEAFVAEQLFQNPEHCLHDLYQAAISIFPSSKVQAVGFVSSIFLRRLLHPAVYNSIALRSALNDYGKKWSDHEFQALTVDGLRRELLSLIEQEAVAGSPFSVFKCWKEFCSRYFDRWRKANAAFGLLADTLGGAVGLIRENAVSLFRSFEDIELLMHGNFEEFKDIPKFAFDASSDGLEHEILFEVLRCTALLSRRLGPAISPLFYESVVGASMIAPEDIVTRLLNTVRCGYNMTMSSSHVSELGTDFVWRKELADHKSLRKFSSSTLVSLHNLCNKAGGWSRVLNVVESYLNLLVPRKPTGKLDSDMTVNASISLIVQATSQVAEVMFESALDVLLFLSYLLEISGQVYILQDDLLKIQHELIPMIHEIIAEWLTIHLLGTMPSESVCVEDFSSQLSSLRIDTSNNARCSWTEKLGSIDFTLASVLLLDAQDSSDVWSGHSLNYLPQPGCFTNFVQHFSGWIIWGGSGEKPLSAFGHSTDIAQRLLRHGQYNAVENLLTVMDSHMRQEKSFGSLQSIANDWCVLHHLLGCCLLAQAHGVLHESQKAKKVNESMRCYFRASSGEGAAHALKKLLHEAGLVHSGTSGCVSTATWKLHYYEWVMQKFEQHGMSDAACQFAIAALEQVDEAVRSGGIVSEVIFTDESATAIKGRLWANVFKFALDLNEFYDAYCAMVSNPDEESKYICLRRFIIVLYERGATKILCNSHLPFIGLNEKVEQELSWKAARSDVLSRPNPYKLLYAFEMHQQNWRMAATYIYLYSTLLKSEMSMRSYQNTSLALQERLNAISAAINCLHLVHPMYAWIDFHMGGSHLQNTSHPCKKARTLEGKCQGDSQAQRQESYIGIEKLEDEFVLASADYLLSLENGQWTHTGNENLPSDLVDQLVDTNLYDMALTVILRFWKDSGLKKQLERVFSSMALKCIPSKSSSPLIGSPRLFLTSSKNEAMDEEPFDVDPQSKQPKSCQWEVLEEYLEKYKGFHGRLPVVVAETLLSSDPQIELPLWLVNYFKGTLRESMGMSGQESNAAALFTLYVDHGRYSEATELLLEYIEAYASVKPASIIHRKRPFATWFPYTAIERLWCRLEEAIRAGYIPEQCEKLKGLLHGALRSHLILLKADSEDAISSAV